MMYQGQGQQLQFQEDYLEADLLLQKARHLLHHLHLQYHQKALAMHCWETTWNTTPFVLNWIHHWTM